MRTVPRTQRVTIPVGGISPLVLLGQVAARISVTPGSGGATVRVFKSVSPYQVLFQDQAAGKFTYAAFNTDSYTGNAQWYEWYSTGVTTPTTEGARDGALFTAVIAISTGGSGASTLEVVE